MKKITWWLLSTATVLVLLFSYRTSTNTDAATTPPSISTPATTRSTSSAATTTVTVTAGGTTAADPSTTAAASADPTTQAASASGTYTGDAADTRYGPVQVQITVLDGKITAATAVEYPYHDRRDQEINDYAIPVLNQEAVDAQSADISLVGGATYTSDGYVQSLQSAIDQAQLS